METVCTTTGYTGSADFTNTCEMNGGIPILFEFTCFTIIFSLVLASVVYFLRKMI